MKIVDTNEFNAANSKKNEILNGGTVQQSLSNSVERTLKYRVNKETAVPKKPKELTRIYKIRHYTKSVTKKNANGTSSPIKRPQELGSRVSGRNMPRSSSKFLDLRKIRLMPKGKSKECFSRSAQIKSAKSVDSGDFSNPPPNMAQNLKNGVSSALSAAASSVKNRALQEDKEGNTGVEGVKLGLRNTDRAIKEARTIKNRVESTVKQVRKISNRLTRSAKTTQRTLRTTATSKRTISTAANTAKTSAKAAAKTAANASRAARATANFIRTTAKIAVKAAKAIAETIQKIASFIAETAPWSLIIIAVIVVLILLVLIINMIIGNVTSTIIPGGAWITDSSTSTPQDMYKNLEKTFDAAKKAFEAKVQNPLKSEINSFCTGDTSSPYRILECQKGADLYFPAASAKTALDGYLSSYDTDFYSDLVATLYILMYRSNPNLKSTDIKQSDFEEFLGSVDANTCKYGSTFVYKTTVEVINCTCPDEKCKYQVRNDNCASYYDETDGEIYYYCAGHYYCTNTHKKLQVNLYKIDKHTNKSLYEIYNFTDDEKKLFTSVKAFIQAFIQEYGSK